MAQFAQGMDRAYWISWFNLPEAVTQVRRHEFFTWAYESYVPKVLAREGMLWGALEYWDGCPFMRILSIILSSAFNIGLH